MPARLGDQRAARQLPEQFSVAVARALDIDEPFQQLLPLRQLHSFSLLSPAEIGLLATRKGSIRAALDTMTA